MVRRRIVVIKGQSPLEFSICSFPIFIECVEEVSEGVMRLGRSIIQTERFLNFFLRKLRLVRQLVNVRPAGIGQRITRVDLDSYD